MRRLFGLLAIMALFVLPLSAQSFRWLEGCWLSEPGNGLQILERWTYTEGKLQLIGGTMRNGEPIERVEGEISGSGADCMLYLNFSSVGASEWYTSNMSSSSCTWHERGGDGRSLVIRRTGNTITSTAYDSDGNRLSGYTYSKVSCE